MVIFGSVVAGGFGDPVFAGPVVDDLGLAKALAWPLLIVALGCLSLAIDNPFCRQAALGCYLVGALGLVGTQLYYRHHH